MAKTVQERWSFRYMNRIGFMIEKVYPDYLNDVPHYIIHRELKNLGFPQTATNAIFRILNNPLYCGLVRVCAHGKHLEKLVKGIREAIIPEHLYHRAQEKLKRNKRKMNAKPKEEYPLKGVIKSPCCGRDLTAGWCKGKMKKYLYYRCPDHSNVNISRIELHDKFDELLRHLSFTKEFVDEVVQLVSEKVKTGLKSSHQRHHEIRMQLQAVDAKIEGAENSYLQRL